MCCRCERHGSSARDHPPSSCYEHDVLDLLPQPEEPFHSRRGRESWVQLQHQSAPLTNFSRHYRPELYFSGSNMNPELHLPPKEPPRLTELPRESFTSRLRNVMADEPQAGPSLVQISSLPGNFTRQPGSTPIPNVGQLAQGFLPAHNLPPWRVSQPTVMPSSSLMRPRMHPQKTRAKKETVQDEGALPPLKRPRKNAKSLLCFHFRAEFA